MVKSLLDIFSFKAMADEDKPEVRVELHSIPEYNDPINNFKVPEDVGFYHGGCLYFLCLDWI